MEHMQIEETKEYGMAMMVAELKYEQMLTEQEGIAIIEENVMKSFELEDECIYMTEDLQETYELQDIVMELFNGE